jgi:hypothetical protein
LKVVTDVGNVGNALIKLINQFMRVKKMIPHQLAEWALWFYGALALWIGVSLAWGCVISKKPDVELFKTFDEPCRCEHPIKCDFYDQCTKGKNYE